MMYDSLNFLAAGLSALAAMAPIDQNVTLLEQSKPQVVLVRALNTYLEEWNTISLDSSKISKMQKDVTDSLSEYRKLSNSKMHPLSISKGDTFLLDHGFNDKKKYTVDQIFEDLISNLFMQYSNVFDQDVFKGMSQEAIEKADETNRKQLAMLTFLLQAIPLEVVFKPTFIEYILWAAVTKTTPAFCAIVFDEYNKRKLFISDKDFADNIVGEVARSYLSSSPILLNLRPLENKAACIKMFIEFSPKSDTTMKKYGTFLIDIMSSFGNATESNLIQNGSPNDLVVQFFDLRAQVGKAILEHYPSIVLRVLPRLLDPFIKLKGSQLSFFAAKTLVLDALHVYKKLPLDQQKSFKLESSRGVDNLLKVLKQDKEYTLDEILKETGLNQKLGIKVPVDEGISESTISDLFQLIADIHIPNPDEKAYHGSPEDVKHLIQEHQERYKQSINKITRLIQQSSPDILLNQKKFGENLLHTIVRAGVPELVPVLMAKVPELAVQKSESNSAAHRTPLWTAQNFYIGSFGQSNNAYEIQQHLLTFLELINASHPSYISLGYVEDFLEVNVLGRAPIQLIKNKVDDEGYGLGAFLRGIRKIYEALLNKNPELLAQGILVFVIDKFLTDEYSQTRKEDVKELLRYLLQEYKKLPDAQTQKLKMETDRFTANLEKYGLESNKEYTLDEILKKTELENVLK